LKTLLSFNDVDYRLAEPVICGQEKH